VGELGRSSTSEDSEFKLAFSIPTRVAAWHGARVHERSGQSGIRRGDCDISEHDRQVRPCTDERECTGRFEVQGLHDRDGTTHLVMTPLEFLQHLAALVPRPRLHLIRFHGVLAPNAALCWESGLAVPYTGESFVFNFGDLNGNSAGYWGSIMFFAKYSALQDMTPNPSRQASFAQFPSPHATMKRHAGPILEKWAGQTLLAGYTPAYQTAESAD